MTVYRIKNWAEHFENNKSKERDRCSYVCMPNKQDGMGLQRILGAPNGAAIFGLWCLILQKASRQKRPREGWLTDDGDADSAPWNLADLAFQWRQDAALLEAALDLFCDPRVGWLQRSASAFSVNPGKLGGHSAGTFVGQSARLRDESARPESESARLEAESAQERKKERKKEGRKGDLTLSHSAEGEADGADSTEGEPTDESLLHLVRSLIFWQVKDPDQRAQHQASILAWLRADRDFVCHIAKREHAASRKAIPWWELVEVIESEHARPVEQERPVAPELAPALAIVDRVGWEKVNTLLGFLPGKITSDRHLRATLADNIPACRELIEKAPA